uniref:Thioredoxin domain-containing protein n=1 Tax=Ditylum brightwellii TaxID=49249 RepID=A0A6V2Q587_9STRA|mmetsp:Transcript_3606/g.5467  ORF Transcript_3606/g.5467 Transcript_3606/m.5467 type:complete len:253 (+) Transcript_3606:25-783(+)
MAKLLHFFVVSLVASTIGLAHAFTTNAYVSKISQTQSLKPSTVPPVPTQRNLFFADSSEKIDDGHSTNEAKAIGSPPSETERRTIPRMTVVNEVQDFLDFLGEDERLCVVKFYAKWCKSCQKFGVKFRHLALEEADKLDPVDGKMIEKGRVRFAEVEFTANAKLCRAMKIKRLPYVHFYKACAGRLTHFSCGPAKFQKVVDQMNEYLAMSDEEIIFAATMDEGQSLGDELATVLQEQHHNQGLENLNAESNL